MCSIKSSVDAWSGILPIVSIPFTSQGTIDCNSFENTLVYIDNTSAMGMVLFGIASEFYKLTDAEKEQLATIYFSTNLQKKRIVSITAHATDIAVQQAVEYEKMGADGLMLLPPFFLNPSKQSILSHIERVANAVNIPVLLQIASGETGVSYEKEDILSLHKQYSNLFFKIEGNPAPLELIQNLITASSEIKIFNGYAGIFMQEMLEAKCVGIMPGCSFIEIYTEIYDLFIQFHKEQSKKLHSTLLQYIFTWMSHCEYIIQIEKTILMKRGIISTDYCRSPGYSLTKKDNEDIDSFITQFYGEK